MNPNEQPGTSSSHHHVIYDRENTAARTRPFILTAKSRVKYLSRWSLHMKEFPSDSPISTPVFELSGILLSEDGGTRLERNHDAGCLVFRIGTNEVKSTNGLYHLIGPVAGGFPNNIYRACLENNDIPENWEDFLPRSSSIMEIDEASTSAERSVHGTVTNYQNSLTQECFEILQVLRRRYHPKFQHLYGHLYRISAEKLVRDKCLIKKPHKILNYKYHLKLNKALEIMMFEMNVI